jgi:hypothetical protein
LNPSGLISGNTTAQGTFNVTIQVSDTNGITDTMSYSFDVTAVHVTTANVPNGVVGAPYSKNLAAAGGTVPYTWSHYAGTLPSGLSIDQAGAVVGTPTSVGTFNFTVRVIDANGIADYKGFTTTIAKTTITTASLPNGKVNNAYNKTMAANSGTAPYSWSVTGGALPTGLTLSTGGVISGTPTVAGTASVTIQAADANGINDSQNYSLLIKP